MSVEPAEIPPEGIGALARNAFTNRSFLIGFVITALIAGMALLSFVWSPYDVTDLVRCEPHADPVRRNTGSAPIISAATSCR